MLKQLIQLLVNQLVPKRAVNVGGIKLLRTLFCKEVCYVA